MALVSVDDLTEYMSDISLTSSQRAAAQVVLDGVQQELETYLNRPLSPVMVREIGVADHSGFLQVSVSPVHQIVSIQPYLGDERTQEAVVTPLDRELNERTVDWLPVTGAVTSVTSGHIYTGYPTGWVIVKYIGGYNGYVDDALRLNIMRVAAREMTMNHDDTLSLKDDFPREPANAVQAKGWQPDELRKWDRLRRRVAV